jgi:tetratricopeptide (TPR) repeat protein
VVRKALLLAFSIIAYGQVKVWEGRLTLPVSEEGPPDPNPPFDQFATTRFNYPYTLRTTLTGRRIDRDLRALYLENEYLKCSVLPDVGGHVYSCTDKINGREMFYANPSLKKQLIGYRGAWSAFGIEFNFPVSHNWMSMSPVDFAMRQDADGSGSVIVGNIDRPYGMQWRVELILRPASTVLEERVTLYNRGDYRRRYYWWNNAAAEVGDDSKIYYPMRFSASHGFTFVDTWPVNHEGLDVSIVKNHTAGPVSQFVHGSREPFMGVWHPRWNAGVVHYANYADLPGKKIWSFGVDPDGLDWRRALSDNNSGYVEIQAGLFRNQETYAFLPPQGVIQFSEYWMPVREIGGISRANLNGVVYLSRQQGKLRVALNVNQAVRDAQIRVLDGTQELLTRRETLDPSKSFIAEVEAPAGRKCTFELRDAEGKPLLAHTEDTYDWTPESEVRKGPQPAVRQEGLLEAGADQELNGELLLAMQTYRGALEHAPHDFELNKAAGRLAVMLRDYDAGLRYLKRALEARSNDPEVQYYLGHAYRRLGDPEHARDAWEGAQRQPQFRPAARIELAQLEARGGNSAGALRYIREAEAEHPDMVRAGGIEAALLRSMGRESEARERAEQWLSKDPTNSLLRYEAIRLGRKDDSLWRHLAGDPERVIEIAVAYMNLGLYADVIDLLSRDYPQVSPDEAEPGTPSPKDYPLIAYYRGFCRERLGGSGEDDYRAASRMSTRYVFPGRPTDIVVLRQAIERDANDASAHFFLGDLYFSGGMTDRAINEWRKARSINPRIPVLHRNLGRALFLLKQDQAAIDVFREGLKADPTNVELYTGLTQALAILDRPAEERVRVLESYPDRAAMPSPLALDLALSNAEAGKFRDAEAVFRNRHFEKEEGAANAAEVYVEVRLQEALASAQHGQADEARRILASLMTPVEGLEFTPGALRAAVDNPRLEYYQGQVESLLGNGDAARELWTKAAAGHGVFAVLAAKQLDKGTWKARATEMSSGRSVDAGDALLALGRTDEAKKVFLEVLREPDHNLSHYRARRGLAMVDKG